MEWIYPKDVSRAIIRIEATKWFTYACAVDGDSPHGVLRVIRVRELCASSGMQADHFYINTPDPVTEIHQWIQSKFGRKEIRFDRQVIPVEGSEAGFYFLRLQHVGLGACDWEGSHTHLMAADRLRAYRKLLTRFNAAHSRHWRAQAKKDASMRDVQRAIEKIRQMQAEVDKLNAIQRLRQTQITSTPSFFKLCGAAEQLATAQQ